MTEFQPLNDTRDNLGEGPVWDPATGTLWRVDLHEGLIHGIDTTTGAESTTRLGGTVSFVLPTSTGEFAVGNDLDVKILDRNGRSRLLASVDAPASTRFNDGKTDPLGRIVGGTMATDWQHEFGTAALFLVDGGGRIELLGKDLTIGNGLDWDVERGRFYHVDSKDQTIYVFDYDPTTGAYANRRPFAVVPGDEGLPDGVAVDAEGGVWLALFFSGELRRYDPDGSLSQIVTPPVSNVTSLCFGDPDLRTAYITTAWRYLDDEQRAAQPLAGAVLAADLGVAGRPITRVAL